MRRTTRNANLSPHHCWVSLHSFVRHCQHRFRHLPNGITGPNVVVRDLHSFRAHHERHVHIRLYITANDAIIISRTLLVQHWKIMHSLAHDKRGTFSFVCTPFLTIANTVVNISPTLLLVRRCWNLLHSFTHHSISEKCPCPNKFGNCCVHLHAGYCH